LAARTDPINKGLRNKGCTHNDIGTVAIGRAVNQGWDHLVSQAIGMKGPPYMLLDLVRPVLKYVIFKILLDKFKGFGSYQRVLEFELPKCLRGYGHTVSAEVKIQARLTIITISSPAVTVNKTWGLCCQTPLV
jgi:hypothetical protein